MQQSSLHNRGLDLPKIIFFRKQKKINILICQISEPSSEGTVLSALFFTSNGHFVNGADVCDVGFKNNLAIPTILVCYFVHIRSSVCPDMNDRKLK